LLPHPRQQLLPAADSIKCAVLDAVVHESLRCANTAGAVTRSATQDTTILGKFIPKGTTIYVPLSLIQSSSGHQAHSDEARSESSKATKKITAWDPKTVLEFEPSRWLVDGRFDSKAGPWMPFSLGPRGCYGRALAVSHRLYENAQGTLIVPRNRFSSSSSSSLKSHSRSSSSRSQKRSNLWIMSSLSLANPRSPTSVRDRGSRPSLLCCWPINPSPVLLSVGVSRTFDVFRLMQRREVNQYVMATDSIGCFAKAYTCSRPTLGGVNTLHVLVVTS
jgi:hypothetical protein